MAGSSTLMRAPNQREQRLLAILILVALIAIVQLVVIGPIASGFAARAERRELLLTRYAANERLIAAIPRLRRRAEALRGTADRFALPAPDAAAGGELLAERLQRLAEGSGAEYRGAETVAARAGWAAVRISLHLSAEQLQALLAVAQNQTPYLVIDALVVTADEALVVGRPSALDVQFEATVPIRPAPAR